LNKSHPRNQIFARQVKNLVGFFLVNICLAGCLATPQCGGAHDPEVVSSVIELGCCSNAFDCFHQASDSPRGFHRRVCIGLADQDKGLKNLGIAKAVTAVPCDVSPKAGQLRLLPEADIRLTCIRPPCQCARST